MQEESFFKLLAGSYIEASGIIIRSRRTAHSTWAQVYLLHNKSTEKGHFEWDVKKSPLQDNSELRIYVIFRK